MQKSYDRSLDTTWKRHDLLRAKGLVFFDASSDVLAVGDVLDDVRTRFKMRHDESLEGWENQGSDERVLIRRQLHPAPVARAAGKGIMPLWSVPWLFVPGPS